MNILFTLLMSQTCQVQIQECRCYPAVPFEGYQIHLYERCDDKEAAYKGYDERSYDTAEQCAEAVANDADCQNLK